MPTALGATPANSKLDLTVPAAKPWWTELLRDDPYFVYPLDEAYRNVYHDVALRNGGSTDVGSDPFPVAEGGPLATPFNATEMLGNSNGYIAVPAPDAPIATDGVTLSAWARSDGAASSRHMIRLENVWALRANGTNLDGIVWLDVGGTPTVFVATATGVVTVGAWHHYAMTWDGANIRLYKDGVQVGTAAAAGTLNIPGIMNSLVIGNHSAGTTGFDGRLFGAAAFPTALSAARLAAHAGVDDYAGPESRRWTPGATISLPLNTPTAITNCKVATTLVANDGGNQDALVAVSASAIQQTNVAATLTLRVRHTPPGGTATSYVVAQGRTSIQEHVNASGSRLFTGLAPGVHRFELEALATGAAFSLDANDAASISVVPLA